MKPTAAEPSLELEHEIQVERCSRDRFLELGEKQRRGEIQMTALEQGNLNSGRVKGPRYLYSVTYEILKVAFAAPPQERKPEVFVQTELI